MTSSLAERSASADQPTVSSSGGSGPPEPSGNRVPWHIRLGLSWSSGSPPIVLALLVGMALGPGWLALLNASTLAVIAPALPVAMAALGAQLTLALPSRPSARDESRFAAACLEGVITAVIVAIGLWLLLPGNVTSTIPEWLIAVAAGICAATSASLPADSRGVSASTADIRQLDVLLPALCSGIVLAWLREGSVLAALLLTGEAMLLTLAIGVAAWVLLSRQSSETEQRIFGASALLLLGGLADYLALSGLFAGLLAGAFWRLAGGPAAEALRKGIAHVQHPLVVLMLVAAGARIEIGKTALALAIAYPLLRTSGKLAGAWLARRVTRPQLPQDLGLGLVTPGVFGVALAVSTATALGPQGGLLLAVVVLGTIASQVMASRSAE